VSTQKENWFLHSDFTIMDDQVAYFLDFIGAIMTSSSPKTIKSWWRDCTPFI
jgi:hypothetical protein